MPAPKCLSIPHMGFSCLASYHVFIELSGSATLGPILMFLSFAAVVLRPWQPLCRPLLLRFLRGSMLVRVLINDGHVAQSTPDALPLSLAGWAALAFFLFFTDSPDRAFFLLPGFLVCSPALLLIFAWSLSARRYPLVHGSGGLSVWSDWLSSICCFLSLFFQCGTLSDRVSARGRLSGRDSLAVAVLFCQARISV